MLRRVHAVDLTDELAHRSTQLADAPGHAAFCNHRRVENLGAGQGDPEELGGRKNLLTRFHCALHVGAHRTLKGNVVAVSCTLSHLDLFSEFRHEGLEELSELDFVSRRSSRRDDLAGQCYQRLNHRAGAERCPLVFEPLV